MRRKRKENRTYNTCEQQEGMIYNGRLVLRLKKSFLLDAMHVNVKGRRKKKGRIGKDEELLVDNSKGERLWMVLNMIDEV